MSSPTDVLVTTDLARIDLDVVHRWLSEDAFWALGRSRETVDLAARNSLNFGALGDAGRLLGYARVVTDHATFAWLCDVYVAPSARGRGVGIALAQAVVDRLAPLGLKRILLSTLDAHDLYARFGFRALDDPGRLMILPGP